MQTESSLAWWSPAELRPHAGSLVLHQSQMRRLQIVSIGLLIDAQCGMSARHRRKQSQGCRRRRRRRAVLFPPQVGRSSLWQCGVCGLGPTAGTLFFPAAVNTGYETTSHGLAVCESDSRCSAWITTSGSALLILTSAEQPGSFAAKEERPRYHVYRSAQICSFAKDIKMKASDWDAASRREGAWRDMKSQPQGFDCFFFFFSISQEASLWSSECLPSKLTPGLRTAVVTHLCHHQSTRHSPPNNPSTGHMFDEPSFEESGLKNICPRRLINVPTRPGHRSQAKPSARQRRRSQSVPRSSSKSSTIIKISQVLSSHLYLRPVGTKEVWQRQWIPAVSLKFGMKKLSGILVP